MQPPISSAVATPDSLKRSSAGRVLGDDPAGTEHGRALDPLAGGLLAAALLSACQTETDANPELVALMAGLGSHTGTSARPNEKDRF